MLRTSFGGGIEKAYHTVVLEGDDFDVYTVTPEYFGIPRCNKSDVSEAPLRTMRG